MAAEIFRNSYDQKIEPDTSKPPHRVSHTGLGPFLAHIALPIRKMP